MTTSALESLSPGSIGDVVAVVHDLAASSRAALVVGGGAELSSLPPPSVDVLVCMSDLSGIVDHQPEDLTVTVRAGTTLGELEDVLGARGQTAVLPDGSRDRSVGGVVAAGASGHRRLRYGPTRDRVIGVELVTGYGKRVRGGGRLVKNVTGYDLPRLVTGSRGALGIVTEVTFKLWPMPSATRTVRVSDAGLALATHHRPSAVLETNEASHLYLEGSESSVEAAAAGTDGAVEMGLRWPDRPSDPVLVSVRVPARHVSTAVDVVRRWGAVSFVAQHGVGIIDVGLNAIDDDTLVSMRSEIRGLGGAVVVDRWPRDRPLSDRFGYRANTAGIEDRLRSLFDPHDVLRTGSRWELT